ncbi:MAG: NAD(P)H-dependent oxidoreductase [Chitinophagales bacterium]|nr:NAD(P)H-dependent oxidoreductase [Chitinophagales bacterium]MCZ2394076.1 NAD(P)H-dependent oxidoreductase [Chitinophagales bacterium]
MKNLKIITSTTRPGRAGVAIEKWITEFAKSKSEFNVELLDLSVINLPLMDEPNHPRMQKYQHEHTKQWSTKINDADAFLIVLAEYNFGFPAPIKNALDYLFNEWMHKPVAFVSYGGVSGGLRSSQMLKQVVTTLSMMPITTQVNIPFFTKLIDENGVFQATEVIERSAEHTLYELKKWSNALSLMRSK